MKNFKYVLFMIILLLCSSSFAFAECTEEELTSLRDQVKNIKITYKHMGVVETEESFRYNDFLIKVKNMPDDFYVLLMAGTVKLTPTDGMASTTLSDGTWDFDVYSSKCEEKLDTIKVKLPTFNMYSLDPLCEGVDSEKFPLCGKFYNYNVSYEDFVERVKFHRQVNHIGEENENTTWYSEIIKKIVDFILKYKWYIGSALLVLIIGLTSLIMWIRARKRGVLK